MAKSMKIWVNKSGENIGWHKEPPRNFSGSSDQQEKRMVSDGKNNLVQKVKRSSHNLSKILIQALKRHFMIIFVNP